MTERGPSHLRAALRLALAGVRRRGAGSAASPISPSRKLAVEQQAIRIDPGQLRRYLRATRGERSDAAADLLPATYSALWETALTLELLSLEGIPFPSGGIVHLASEIVTLRPLQVDDQPRARLEVERMEVHARGTVLVLRFRSWNAAGQLCQENTSEHLLRGVAPPAGAVRRQPERMEMDDQEEAGGGTARGEPDWREVAAWDLSAGAGVRYARASGDFNPIHLWPWSSRLLGFPRPILHGHCSLAMMAHELERATGKRPLKLSGRFRTPLELPSRVRLDGAGDLGGGSAAVRLVHPVRGGRPYVEGRWVGC